LLLNSADHDILTATKANPGAHVPEPNLYSELFQIL
jgi:hypothetical protein